MISVMRCLATFFLLMTVPTARAILSLPRSGRRARRVAALILASSASVAASSSPRLRAPLGFEERVVAGDQPLARVVRGCDLGHVLDVEQGG